MRKFSYKAPESQETIVTTGSQLSREEQAILQDDQNAALTQLESAGDDIDRLVDTEASIQDTLLIVDQTPTLGVVEQGLVDAVADVAVAGTDAAPEQVIASSPDGIATEGFVSEAMERLKQIWDKIKEYLINAWKSLVEYLAGEKRQVEAISKQAEEVEKFIEENHSILMLEYTPENVKRVKSLRLQHQRSDQAMPMPAPQRVALGYDKGVDERAAERDAAAQAQKEKDQADYDQRVESEAQARADSDARLEAERQAVLEKALSDLRGKLAGHRFRFKGDINLISTTAGVPKDFEKEVVNLASYSQQVHKSVAHTLRDLCHSFEEVLTKFEGSNPQSAIIPFVERFHKDFEVLGRAIGEMKDTDGLLRAHTRVPLLGQFDVEITDEKKAADAKPASALSAVGRATLSVSAGTAKSKNTDVPLLPELLTPATAVAIKRWTEFQLGHDAAGVEKTLKEYGEKFIGKIDRLVQIQQSVKGVADDNQSYHVIQGMINVCRGLDKMIIEFTLKYASTVRRIMQSALQYQLQAAEERVRMYKDAVANF